ncbi:DnaJ domain-containing protein [Simiduia litorea]|uniref:J domain-containing protein n=1 Tax=Simiduia litorea TaxID=1435348 RepID=UPI0036F25664
MSRLIPLFVILVLVYLAYRKYQRLTPSERKKWLWQLGVAAFLGLILFALFTGRLNWLGAFVMGLLPFLKNIGALVLRGMAVLGWWKKMQNAKPMDSTSLVLNLKNGIFDGDIRKGTQAGRKLSDLNTEQLDQLFQEFSGKDARAAALLQIYIKNRFGDTWQGSPLNQHSPDGDLTVAEARALLGVEADADKKTIIAAHRKLIQKFHPDRGGNDYLAARLNTAKDLLLKQFNGNEH